MTALKFFTNLRTLPQKARTFIQLQAFFGGMTAILTLFVNTFLLNAFGSFSAEVLLYNGIMALVQPIAMFTALWVTSRKNALVAQRIGFVFYGLALTVLCLFGDKVSAFYPLFAALISFGAGYYYTTYGSQMLTYTEDGNRDLIAGITGVVGAVISILLPLLSGFLITIFDKNTGYRIVFGIAALLALGALLTSLRLPQIPKHNRKGSIGKVFRTILKDRNGRLIMVANGLSNCCGFTVPIYVTLLFYNLAPNELLISVNSTVGYVVTLLGSSLYGILVTKKNRVGFSVGSAILVMLPCLGMLFGLNIIMIMVFQAVYSLSLTFRSTPILNTHFKVVEKLGLRSEYGAEVHFVREFFVSVGRSLGLALVWIIPQTTVGAVTVLLCLMLTSMLDAWILRTIQKSGVLDD